MTRNKGGMIALMLLIGLGFAMLIAGQVVSMRKDEAFVKKVCEDHHHEP